MLVRFRHAGPGGAMECEIVNRDDDASKRMTKGDFYRICRVWHGYLSAVAFFALILFSVTGILLNHPGLLQGASPRPIETSLVLTPDELAEVTSADAPANALVDIVGARAGLAGAFRSSEIIGDDVYINMQGVRGRSDITGNLQSGEVDVYVERESFIGVLNGLHRAERAGDVWRLLVDVLAIVFIAMALIGLALFLSLRFRVRRAAAIMAATLVLMIGVFAFATV